MEVKKIIVYTTDYCGYCEGAKKLLEHKNLKFEEISVANDDEKKLELMRKTAHRTLPQIFIDDEFIGGYVELKDFLDKKGY